MKVNDYNVTFEVTTYADMFHRKAVLAIIADGEEKGELYGDVTINIPQYLLDEGESFISADCPELIREMVKYEYLEIVGEIRVNFGTYKIGKFTQKFADKFDKEAVFTDLEKAKNYYYPEDNKAFARDEYTGSNYEEYCKDYKEYKEEIMKAENLEELADVLNKYTDEFDNGTEYFVEEM